MYGTLYCAAGLLSLIGFNVLQGVEVSMTDHPDKVNQCLTEHNKCRTVSRQNDLAYINRLGPKGLTTVSISGLQTLFSFPSLVSLFIQRENSFIYYYLSLLNKYENENINANADSQQFI